MTEPKVTKEIEALLQNSRPGVKLDVGCGGNKQNGFIGLDMRDLPGVDIVHNAEEFPYPLPGESCSIILCSHLIEHIKPWLMINFMNELWRLLEVNGQLWASMPYATSFGFVQDPTHCNPCNEATWQYFDPQYPLYNIYTPKPYRIQQSIYRETGNMEIVLVKRSLEELAQIQTPKLAGNDIPEEEINNPKEDA